MDLHNLFTGDCEIVKCNDEWMYPIFKAGWTGIQRYKQDAKVNKEITNFTDNIVVHVREPEQRFTSAVNKYSQMHQITNADVLHAIKHDTLSDRHWLPQYHWLQHLARYHRGDITLRPMHKLPFRDSVGKGENYQPVEILQEYCKADRILMSMCGQRKNLNTVLEDIKNVLS